MTQLQAYEIIHWLKALFIFVDIGTVAVIFLLILIAVRTGKK